MSIAEYSAALDEMFLYNVQLFKDYPNIQLELTTKDDSTRTAPQLDYWRVQYDKVPEAAVDPELILICSKMLLRPALMISRTGLLEFLAWKSL